MGDSKRERERNHIVCNEMKKITRERY